jgi:phosphate transport system permease protein
MTDATVNPSAQPKAKSSLHETDARTRKRNAAEKRFKAYGIGAIAIGIFFLVVLAFSIIRSGIPAFTQTVVSVDFTLTQEQFDDAESQLFKTKAYSGYFNTALVETLKDEGLEVAADAKAFERILGKTGGTLREYYRENPGELGQEVEFELSASSRVDGYMNGRLTRDNMEDSRFLEVADLDTVDALIEAGIIKEAFNWNFITGADSGVDNPGGAGIGASVVGSFFMMLVVLFLSLPIGVAASIYLEEFAPQNRFTDLIEVNISNLAAVPSIVFGILGLAVLIQFMHLPQYAP